MKGEPDCCRVEEAEHDGSPDWPGTLGEPIVLSFDGNRWNRSGGRQPEHVPFSPDGRPSPFS